MKTKTLQTQLAKTMLVLGFLFYANFTNAQNVEKIELKGTTYTVTQDFPKEILGRYLYEKKGEPIVELNENGEGLFQPHMTAPIKIKFWIDCDDTGKLRKKEGIEGRYQYTLLIQYLDGTNGNYPAGGYDLMGVLIAKDLGNAIIYGERYKKLDN